MYIGLAAANRRRKMRLFNVKTVKKVVIYGAINYRCFSIRCTSDEFEELKKTGVLIAEVSIYDTFVSIECNVNTERTADLISKALSMGIQITYYCKED